MGGRSSGGGNKVTANAQNVEAKATTKTTADERNARELARVQRENRLSGVDSIRDLKKGETYSIKWGRNETRQGTYIGGRMVNGIAVQEFRGANGKIMRIDNEDVRRTVSRR